MPQDPKQHFVEQLKLQYREIISGAHRSESAAGRAYESARAEARSKDEFKNAASEGRLAMAHQRRRREAKRELEALIAFVRRGIPRFDRRGAVGLGALVDVSLELDDEVEERTLLLLPVGAGHELTGPGGDGFVSVITPASPAGRALHGARVGDSVEVVMPERRCDWTVVDLT